MMTGSCLTVLNMSLNSFALCMLFVMYDNAVLACLDMCGKHAAAFCHRHATAKAYTKVDKRFLSADTAKLLFGSGVGI